MAESKYCAVAWYRWGSTEASILASNQRIILFDTLVIAQQFLPQLGQGRIPTWSKDGESICFTPVEKQGVNRATILTGYDPYNLPANMPDGILSEARGIEWKHHVMWSHVFFDCGQFVKRADGTYANTAIGES
jgi:hypothetical protein